MNAETNPTITTAIRRKSMAYSNSDVAHNWAHQTEQKCRGNNVFYEGNTIYSYGYHFPIARIDTEKNIILYTANTYSTTTARHKSIVWEAISHKDVIVVDNVIAESTADHLLNVKGAIDDIKQLLTKAARARTKGPFHMEQAEARRQCGMPVSICPDTKRYAKSWPAWKRLTLFWKSCNASPILPASQSAKQNANAKKRHLKKKRSRYRDG